jgi:hypothetical protein
MSLSENSVAFGAPGIEPRWTSSAKEGLGTAYHTSCRVWFTLSHGIVNEIHNSWASTTKTDTSQISALNLWFADLPTEHCPVGSVIEFAFYWKDAQRSEARHYSVAVSGSM